MSFLCEDCLEDSSNQCKVEECSNRNNYSKVDKSVTVKARVIIDGEVTAEFAEVTFTPVNSEIISEYLVSEKDLVLEISCKRISKGNKEEL